MLIDAKTKEEQPRIEKLSKWLRVHPGLGISMIDHLYNKLDGAYPGQFAVQFKNETSIQNWRIETAEALEDENIQPHQIAPGLRELRRLYPDYPPSAGKLVIACKAAIPPAAHRDFAPAPMLTHKADRATSTGAARFSEYTKTLWGEDWKKKRKVGDEELDARAWETMDAPKETESPR